MTTKCTISWEQAAEYGECCPTTFDSCFHHVLLWRAQFIYYIILMQFTIGLCSLLHLTNFFCSFSEYTTLNDEKNIWWLLERLLVWICTDNACRNDSVPASHKYALGYAVIYCRGLLHSTDAEYISLLYMRFEAGAACRIYMSWVHFIALIFYKVEVRTQVIQIWNGKCHVWIFKWLIFA